MAKASQRLKPEVFNLAKSGLPTKEIVARMPELSQATVYRYVREFKGQALNEKPKGTSSLTPLPIRSRNKVVA